MSWEVVQADCIEVMKEMDEASVDAVVCDPPYLIEFMGRTWDRAGDVRQPDDETFHRSGAGPFDRAKVRHGGDGYGGSEIGRRMQEWHQAWATEAFRVLKPGGHLLAAGGTRTFHRLVSAIEDAGFEIRDCIAHMFGSGFPKSLNIGEGRGTALKPAFEPWTLARKPLVGTVAANVERFGTGALNIDGTRISGEPWKAHRATGLGSVKFFTEGETPEIDKEPHDAGRWPPNVCLSHLDSCEPVGERRVKSGPSPYVQQTESGGYGGDLGNVRGQLSTHYADPDGLETVEAWDCAQGCPVAELDRQSGERVSGSRVEGVRSGMGFHGANGDGGPAIEGSVGGASRFFPTFPWKYQAKASRAERDSGLHGSAYRDGKICQCERTPIPEVPEPLRDTDAPIEVAASGSSTTGSGSKRTAQSPKASKSTTSTATERTTASTTSPSSPRPNTSESTPPTSDVPTKDGSGDAPSAASGSPPTPNTSTSASRAGSSTDAVDPAISSESSRTSSGGVCPDCGGVVRGALRNSHPT